MNFELRMAWFATALCVLTGCNSEPPRVSLPLNCKPSRECALQMAKARARAEVKYERQPIRYVDTLDSLAHIVAYTGGGPDQLDPLLADLWLEVRHLPAKQRDEYTKFFARTQSEAGRFDEALATVRKVQDTGMRDEAWLLQTTVLTRAGRLEQAAWAAEQISGAKARDDARQTMMEVLANEGRPDLARQAATRLGTGVEGNGIVTLRIAVAEVNAGNDAEARRLADTLNVDGRAHILREIVGNELRQKRPQQALLSLRHFRSLLLKIGKPGPAFDAMSSEVVRWLCQLQVPEEALDLVARMSPESQPRLLAVIAEAQARAGHLDAASTTVQRIPEGFAQEHDIARAELVAARTAAGLVSPETAFSTFQDVRVQLEGKCDAARMLAERNQLDKARAILRASVASAPLPAYPPTPYKGFTLDDVIGEQIELGFFDDALASAERIPSARLRIWNLQQALASQAARGLTADAVKTLGLALALARAQGQAADFLTIFDEAAKAGLAAEAFEAARMQSDWATRDTAFDNLVVPLIEQGHLNEAFAAAADVRLASSSSFTHLFAALSEKKPHS